MNVSELFSSNTLNWLKIILSERFGLDLKLTYSIQHDQTELVLSLFGAEGRIIFDRLDPAFHQSRSDFPCQTWNSVSEDFNAILDKDLPAPSTEPLTRLLFEEKNGDYYVHYDILGLTYWMLTRLEEVGRIDLDDHERFPSTSSHAFINGYLERPIVDEWLHILGQVMKKLWPQVRLTKHEFSMKVSHDVDSPARYAFLDLIGLIRVMGGDLIKRKDLKSAIIAPWIWFNSKDQINPKDPANTFDWLMSQSELNGLTSAFYFICGRTSPLNDALYELESPAIRSLIRQIHDRGHEIGLHPSYNTFRSPEQIKLEADRLRNVCKSEGVKQDQWGGRMHFLRWDQSITQKAWADAGMNYDSTLSYADRPGFRCGTCYEFPAFDLINDQLLSLRVRPLIAMDCSVISERYLGMGSTEAAYEKFVELKHKCQKVGGTYSLLWHNSFFNCPKDFSIYKRLISKA